MSIFLGAGAPIAWEAIGLVAVLLVAGFLLLGVEMFVLPGFGVVGILGALSLLAGMLTAWFMIGPLWGGIVVAVTSVLVVVFAVAAVRSRAVRKRLVLEVSHSRGGGSEASDMGGLVGRDGEARSDLRPAGIAMIDGKRVDVVSDGGFIDKGSKVKVVAVDGPRVVVARVQ